MSFVAITTAAARFSHNDFRKTKNTFASWVLGCRKFKALNTNNVQQ